MPIIGRHKTPCLICGFAAPHVKRNDGKLPYWHCPSCGAMLPTKNLAQANGLMAGMRPVGDDAPKPPAADDPIVIPREMAAAAMPASTQAVAPAPAPAAAPVPPRKPAGIWDQLAGRAR